MSGRVCEKHQEFCPEGVCRWCAPEPEPEHGPEMTLLDYARNLGGPSPLFVPVEHPVHGGPMTSEEIRAAAKLSEELESKRFYFHGVPMETDPSLGRDEVRWIPWDGKPLDTAHFRKFLDEALARIWVVLAKMDQE